MATGPKTQTVENDPWKNMPEWQQELLQWAGQEGKSLYEDARGLGERDVIDLSPEEYQAFDDFQTAQDQAAGLGDTAQGIVGGLQGDDLLGFTEAERDRYGFDQRVAEMGGEYDPRNMTQDYGPGDFESGYAAGPGYEVGYEGGPFEGGYEAATFDPRYGTTDFTGAAGYEAAGADAGYTGDRLTGMIGSEAFGDDYVDDVVDTTLEGMRRQEAAARNQRELAAGATGGIGGSMLAVENAVRGAEANRAMAQTEAQLRSDAARYGDEMLLQQAGMLDESDVTRGQMGMDAQRLAEEQRQAAAGFSMDEAQMSESSRQFLSEIGMSADELSDQSRRFLSDEGLREQTLSDESKRAAESFGLDAAKFNDLTRQFEAQMNMDEQQMADASAQAAQQFGITIDEMNDLRQRYLADRETAIDQFGLDFDAGMMDRTTGAFGEGQRFDMDRANMLDAFGGTELARALQGYGVSDMFGQRQRGIDQARADAPYANIDWLTSLISGREAGNAMLPVGGTQTTTTPGNSAFQNALGIGTSLGGAYLMGGAPTLFGSDERIKEDVEDPVGSALDKIRALNDGAKEYSYRDGFGHTEERTTGLMAQDIEQAGITGAVTEIDGVKHVDIYPIVATLTEAVRELDQKVS